MKEGKIRVLKAGDEAIASHEMIELKVEGLKRKYTLKTKTSIDIFGWIYPWLRVQSSNLWILQKDWLISLNSSTNQSQKKGKKPPFEG